MCMIKGADMEIAAFALALLLIVVGLADQARTSPLVARQRRLWARYVDQQRRE